MTSSRVHGTCVRRVDTLSLFTPPANLFPSPSKLSSEICEWHVSLHLARTCIAYGDCVIARGFSGAVLRHDSNTWGGKWEEAEKQTRLCKSIKDGQTTRLHLLNPGEGGRGAGEAFQTSLSPGKLAAGKELAGRMERSPPYIYYLDKSLIKDVTLQAVGLMQVRLIDYFKVHLTAENSQNEID